MRIAARRATVLIPIAALAVYGTVSVASAAPAAPAHATKTLKYFGFDINNASTDPGFIPVAGTNPQVFSQGDELIINDQLASPHRTAGGYPIVGYDAGVCTLTRVPEQNAPQTLANCVVTAAVKGGSITVQGVIRFKSQQPEPAVLSVTGGTGRFDGAAGTVRVSFTKDFKILSFTLR
jgi:ABC-type transport system substrate-binding protein